MRNQAAFNPFAISDKENYPSVDEVFARTVQSRDGSQPCSLASGSSFRDDLPELFSQSQKQQMKAAERTLKTCNREWWRAQGECNTDSDPPATSTRYQGKFVQLVPLMQPVRKGQITQPSPVATHAQQQAIPNQNALPQQSTEQRWTPPCPRFMQESPIGNTHRAQTELRVQPMAQHPTIHLPPGTSVTLTTGAANEGTVLQLHQQSPQPHVAQATCSAVDHKNRNQGAVQASSCQAGDSIVHPTISSHEAYVPGDVEAQPALQGIHSSTVRETPHAKQQGQAAALSLTVVSDSYTRSETACGPVQLPSLGVAPSTERQIQPPLVFESPNTEDVETRMSTDLDHRTRSAVNVHSVGVQAVPLVQSHGTLEASARHSPQDARLNRSLPGHREDEAHEPHMSSQAADVNSQTVAPDQCMGCGSALPAGGCRTVQPAAYKLQVSQEHGHSSQCPGQLDAATQTPQRQQPKRKLPKKDATPVPASKRRIDCSPGHTLESLRSPSAVWPRSPAMLRTAQVSGFQDCVSPGMPVSQLAYAPPSILRQALQPQSPPVRLPPRPQASFEGSPALAAAVGRAVSGALLHSQTPPRIHSTLDSRHHRMKAQMVGHASVPNSPSAEDPGPSGLERGISLRDGIVAGSQEGERQCFQIPQAQLPLMLDRFIYDT